MSIDIIRTGQKYPFKDKQSLKEKIYEMCLENHERAKDLYQKLIPENTDGSNLNLIIANADVAIKCVDAIDGTSDKLIKLFSEINKADIASKEGQNGVSVNSGDVYKFMENYDIKPNYPDDPIDLNAPVIPDENEKVLKFLDDDGEDPFNTESPIELDPEENPEGETIFENNSN